MCDEGGAIGLAERELEEVGLRETITGEIDADVALTPRIDGQRTELHLWRAMRGARRG
jgi:hypothetical protein